MPKKLFLSAATLLLATHLSAQDTDLGTIEVISTNKTPHSIKKTTSNVTVITAEEIEEKGYQTVAQAIHTVSGITVSHAGGLGQQTSFFVRGSDSGKVLVLLDGMRMNDPSTTNGTALLDTLTTENIHQIEIVKGGSSSIWGSNASAGLINIITKEPQKGVHGSAGLSFGSYNTKGADADLAYKGDKLSARIAASYLDTEGFSALAPKDAEADGYRNKNLNVKLGYQSNESNKLSVSYSRTLTETEYDSTFPKNPDDSNTISTSNQTNIALNYSLKLENYSTAFHASKGKYNRKYSYGDFSATLKEYSLINAYSYSNGKAVLGLEYKNIDGYTSGKYTNKAIFSSNTYNINKDTLLETNLRYDNYDAFKNKVTYKLGVKHTNTFFKGLTSSVNFYSAYDAPSSYQLSKQSPTVEILKPTYTKGFEVSVGYKKFINVSYFNSEVNDGINWDGNYTHGGYANIEGKQKFSGLEVLSSYTFFDNINLSANYTHLFQYKGEDGVKLDKRAKDTLNISVDYFYTDHIYFGINTQYIGDREEFGHNTGNYTVWTLNFKSELVDDITLSLHANNIFDKEYQSVYGYATEGRSIHGKLRYKF